MSASLCLCAGGWRGVDTGGNVSTPSAGPAGDLCQARVGGGGKCVPELPSAVSAASNDKLPRGRRLPSGSPDVAKLVPLLVLCRYMTDGRTALKS